MSRPLIFLMLLLLPCLRAHADGGYFPRFDETGQAARIVQSPRQEAILATDGEWVQFILRTHFDGGHKELAWVVPVPAEPTEIGKVDDAVFSEIEALTAPRFYQISHQGKGFGCGCAGMESSQTAVGTGARLVKTGEAGVFEYAVITGRDGSDIARWLTDHRYQVAPQAVEAMKHYAGEKAHFLAMRLRTNSKEKALAPHPITFTYRAKELVFPLIISRTSSAKENEILVHIIAPQRVACGNWVNGYVDRAELRVKPGSPSGTNYEEVLSSASRELKGEVFFSEYFMRWTDTQSHSPQVAVLSRLGKPLRDSLRGRAVVTRLRAIMPAEAMARDVELKPADEQNRWLPQQVIVASAGQKSQMVLSRMTSAGGVAAMLAGVMLMQRKAARWGAGAALIGLVLLAM